MSLPSPESALSPSMQFRIAFSVANKLRKEYLAEYREKTSVYETLPAYANYMEYVSACHAYWACYKTITRWKGGKYAD